MNDSAPTARLIRRFEVITVLAVQLLLVLAVAAATLVIFVLFFHGLRANLAAIESVEALQEKLSRAFAGVLIVLLGLELIETLKAYFVEHHVRAELIFTVALIGLGRHVLQLNVEHASGAQLAGLAALIASLAVGYFLIRRSHAQPPVTSHAATL
jgi:uncharacterized membrane protein (DUF373 family)